MSLSSSINTLNYAIVFVFSFMTETDSFDAINFPINKLLNLLINQWRWCLL